MFLIVLCLPLSFVSWMLNPSVGHAQVVLRKADLQEEKEVSRKPTVYTVHYFWAVLEKDSVTLSEN